MRFKRTLSFFEALSIALFGGLLFTLLQVPLPWMLGPLTLVMIWQLTTKRQLYWPNFFRDLSSLVLGYLLGASITQETGLQILHHLPSMFVVTALTVFFSCTIGYWVAKGAGIGVYSGVFGNVPGGLTQMVLVSEELDEVDATVVTFMQMIRLLGVVFIVPFLAVHGLSADLDSPLNAMISQDAPLFLPIPWWSIWPLFLLVALLGAWGGRKIGLPAAVLTGPLLATALLVLLGLPAPQLPSDTILIAQLLIGVHIGLQMKIENLGNIKKLTLFTVLSSVVLVLFSLLLGAVLSSITGMGLTTAFLATAPGGIAEMGITAAMVHADLSMVTAYQLFRIFFIMFAVPPLLKWWIGRKSRQAV
ncbi:hypothetical protein CIG75_14830 [Tumebacillus algifaecis]|uniref:AbrB family transcriptional regulator n=1 Tax=Tumebacillus algifaecis TaxID=1214604 RepID=A0A223D3M6_9BACL|nr:AbrB family transcriptional regulator [Tumebacillus algifaecis]ASS76105.1 hypothetical protein CIG75_14830 [Tumebacillus algifaecis]